MSDSRVRGRTWTQADYDKWRRTGTVAGPTDDPTDPSYVADVGDIFPIASVEELYKWGFGGGSPDPSKDIRQFTSENGLTLQQFQQLYGGLPFTFNSDGTATFDPAARRTAYSYEGTPDWREMVWPAALTAIAGAGLGGYLPGTESVFGGAAGGAAGGAGGGAGLAGDFALVPANAGVGVGGVGTSGLGLSTGTAGGAGALGSGAGTAAGAGLGLQAASTAGAPLSASAMGAGAATSVGSQILETLAKFTPESGSPSWLSSAQSALDKMTTGSKLTDSLIASTAAGALASGVGGASGGDLSGAMSQMGEEDRKAALRAQVNALFDSDSAKSQFATEDQQLAGSLRGYYADELSRKYDDATRALKFKAADSGNLGTPYADQLTRLDRDKQIGATRIDETVRQALGSLQSQRETSRGNALNLIAGGSGAEAVNAASSGIKNALSMASSASKQQLFGDLLADASINKRTYDAASKDQQMLAALKSGAASFYNPVRGGSGTVVNY